MSARILRRLVGIVAWSLLLSAPASAQQWFDSYARGLRALKEGRADEAIEYLERAVHRRAEPGENLLTYGTHLLDHYHPYLKLAEARLLAGQLEAARDDLARSDSFGQAPDQERDRIRVQIEALEARRAAATTSPPTTPSPTTPPPPTPSTPPTSQAPAPAPVTPEPPRFGMLRLDSEPPGAAVEIAGRMRGTTPLTLQLPPGDHAVTLRKEGTADQGFVVRVEAGRTAAESRQLVMLEAAEEPPALHPAQVEAVVIFTTPGGAGVYLDDEYVGRTDPDSGRLVHRDVTLGAHRLRVTLEDHGDVTLPITVTSEGLNLFRATLTAVAVPARLPRFPLAIVAGVILAAAGWLVLRRRDWGVHVEAPTAALGTPLAGHTPRPEGRRISTPSVSQDLTLKPFATRPSLSSPVRSSDEWFGEYRLVELLGKGGMATVHKVERGGELCALKRPLESFLNEPEFVERFLREAEIGRTLHHPNIIRIYDRGEVEGIPFFTMELVRGETLQSFLRRNPTPPERSATKIVAQVAEALDYAHLKGVVHRDLKPSNIIILDERIVKVMDYGIARSRRLAGITLTGAFLGTPEYAAPEIAEGREAEPRSDLYSLGVIYYETLTGIKPFIGETPLATLRKQCNDPPTPPTALRSSCPLELEQIVLKLLRKNPAERYATAEELLIELRDFLNRIA